MKANNLTIAIPNKGCNKNCPYCISKITEELPINNSLFMINLRKVVAFAKRAQVMNVLITGKGEPLLNLPCVECACDSLKDFPLELQTNGHYLKSDEEAFDLVVRKFDVIALSIDSVETLNMLYHCIKSLIEKGKIIRLCYNLTKKLDIDFKNLIGLARSLGARQIIFRQIITPRDLPEDLTPEQSAVVNWIEDDANECNQNYCLRAMEFQTLNKSFIRQLSYGPEIYDIDGIAVSFGENCLQETHNDDNLRSLIYHQDGHLYTSWNNKASILF